MALGEKATKLKKIMWSHYGKGQIKRIGIEINLEQAGSVWFTKPQDKPSQGYIKNFN